MCLLCFAFPAVAQGDISFVGKDSIGIDISFQIGAVRTQEALDDNVTAIGGRVGYHLGSIFFLDGEILHQPETKQKIYDLDSGVGSYGLGNQKTIILGGIRLGNVFDDKIGVFFKREPARLGLMPSKRA